MHRGRGRLVLSAGVFLALLVSVTLWLGAENVARVNRLDPVFGRRLYRVVSLIILAGALASLVKKFMG